MGSNMLETLIGLLGSGGAGAVVGLVGNWLTKREERKTKIIDNEHDEKMQRLSLQELALEQKHEMAMVDKTIDLAEAEGAITLDGKELDAFTASQKDGGKWMDVAKAIIRPFLTVYTVGLTTVIFFIVNKLVGGLEALPQEQLLEIFLYIIMQVIFLTVMSFSWWFASRQASSRRPTRAIRNGI